MAHKSPTITRLAEECAAQTRGARVEALPSEFRAAFSAFESYLADRRAIVEVDAIACALDDLALLFEQAAADGVPIRSVVGEEPADVAEALLENHLAGSWNTAMRASLTAAIDSA
ncbi:MAG TPA: DUF1048 domain-containing protein [Microbacterium sp.]|jgi:DNA-binding ferritin-like protein (Dps family)|uniref:DUF1048 domain-containing protein n=1 Tax=Microbacterium sp. TaxID=51671 RepID=UPI002F934F64